MKYNEIKNIIRGLAKSQGFYGRLISELDDLEGTTEEEYIKNVLEEQHFSDTLDVVMYFEG